MNFNKSRTQSFVIMSLFVSIGVILQIVESTIPIFTSIPGGKIGLANIVSEINIIVFGGLNACVISVLRAFLGCLLYGGFSAMPYSVLGALISSVSMWIAYRFLSNRLSLIGIGVIGAVMHNFTQIFVARLIFFNIYLWTYLPVLSLIGVLGGIVTGYCANILRVRINFK